MSTAIDMRGRHLLTLADLSPAEITYLIELAAELKTAKREGREEQKLVGKTIALIFEKDSTRTRCAFEVAASTRAPMSLSSVVPALTWVTRRR